MALVVCVTSVVTQEGHGVVGVDMLWMVFDEFLCAFPQGGNGLDVFIQTQNEAVLFAIVLHELERIVVDVAEQFNTGFNAPVVLELMQQRVSKKEARFESAHVSVADGITIDDLPSAHILSDLLCLFLVNPRGEGPVLGGDLAIVSLARNQRSGDLDERLIKWFVVQEDPVIIVVSVESILHLSDGAGNLPEIRVAGQGYKGSIDSFAWSGGGQLGAGHRGDVEMGSTVRVRPLGLRGVAVKGVGDSIKIGCWFLVG